MLGSGAALKRLQSRLCPRRPPRSVHPCRHSSLCTPSTEQSCRWRLGRPLARRARCRGGCSRAAARADKRRSPSPKRDRGGRERERERDGGAGRERERDRGGDRDRDRGRSDRGRSKRSPSPPRRRKRSPSSDSRCVPAPRCLAQRRRAPRASTHSWLPEPPRAPALRLPQGLRLRHRVGHSVVCALALACCDACANALKGSCPWVLLAAGCRHVFQLRGKGKRTGRARASGAPTAPKPGQAGLRGAARARRSPRKKRGGGRERSRSRDRGRRRQRSSSSSSRRSSSSSSSRSRTPPRRARALPRVAAGACSACLRARRALLLP